MKEFVVTHSAEYVVDWPPYERKSAGYTWNTAYDPRDDILSGDELARELALNIVIETIERAVGAQCVNESDIDRHLSHLRQNTYVFGKIRITLSNIITA